TIRRLFTVRILSWCAPRTIRTGSQECKPVAGIIIGLLIEDTVWRRCVTTICIRIKKGSRSTALRLCFPIFDRLKMLVIIGKLSEFGPGARVGLLIIWRPATSWIKMLLFSWAIRVREKLHFGRAHKILVLAWSLPITREVEELLCQNESLGSALPSFRVSSRIGSPKTWTRITTKSRICLLISIC